MRIFRTRQDGDHPAWSSNHICPRLGEQRLDKLGVPRSSFYRMVHDRHQRGGPEALAWIGPHGPIGSGTHVSQRLSAARLSSLALDQPELSPREPTGGCASRTETEYFVSRRPPWIYRLLKAARSYHQPGLHRHQSGRGVQGQDHSAQPALADRFHLSQDLRAGVGAHYLSTVLDDFSRFIVAWKLLCVP